MLIFPYKRGSKILGSLYAFWAVAAFIGILTDLDTSGSTLVIGLVGVIALGFSVYCFWPGYNVSLGDDWHDLKTSLTVWIWIVMTLFVLASLVLI